MRGKGVEVRGELGRGVEWGLIIWNDYISLAIPKDTIDSAPINVESKFKEDILIEQKYPIINTTLATQTNLKTKLILKKCKNLFLPDLYI